MFPSESRDPIMNRAVLENAFAIAMKDIKYGHECKFDN